MPPKDMSFARKSPAEQLLALQPQDIWPIISVSWNPEVCELQFGVRHYAAATDVKGVKATDSILSASALWWAVTVGTLLPLDASTLVERDPIHYWGSYQDSMIQVVAYIKGAGPGGEHHRKVELQSLAAAAVADYNQDIKSMDPDSFLIMLAAEREIGRREHRVPLLHWLSGWAARQQGKTLASCLLLRDPETNLPARCPLDRKAWLAELKGNTAALTFPGVLARLSVPSRQQFWRGYGGSNVAVDANGALARDHSAGVRRILGPDCHRTG